MLSLFNLCLGVRLYFGSEEIQDFSQISSSSLLVSSNILWCQSSANDTGVIGAWYYPDGTNVQDNNNIPLQVSEEEGQIGLFVNGTFDAHDQGLYRCVIPDENNVNQTLVVAIYTSNEFNIGG